MRSDVIFVPGFDTTSHEGATVFGGLVGEWVGESESLTQRTAQIYRIEYRATKLAILSRASSELVDDAPNFTEALMDRMADAVRFNLDNAFINGTGSGQPTGILNDVAKATIMFANLKKMLARLAPSSFENSIWIANPECIPELLSLNEPVGTAGSLMQTQTADGSLRVLTRPVVVSELMKRLGTEGDIALVDLTQYGVALRSDVKIDTSKHLYFQSDEQAIRALMRVDGSGLWNGALSPFQTGADDLSWIVTLAVRA